MKQPHKWKVRTIDQDELSVIWSGYKHGNISYGWADDRKIILCELRQVKNTMAITELKLAARRIAKRLNKLGVVPPDGFPE